jgi:hypothetical protein
MKVAVLAVVLLAAVASYVEAGGKKGPDSDVSWERWRTRESRFSARYRIKRRPSSNQQFAPRGAELGRR